MIVFLYGGRRSDLGSGGGHDIHLKDVPADALRWEAQVVGRGRQLACAVVQGRSWWCVPRRCRITGSSLQE